MIKLVETRKVTEMFGFRCLTCGAWYDQNGNQYWSIAKTRGLHLRGCGGPVMMYRLAEVPA